MSSQQPDGMWVKAEVVMALEAEIATLRELVDARDHDIEAWAKHVDELKAEIATLRQERDVKALEGQEAMNGWQWTLGQLKAAEAENARLRAALEQVLASAIPHPKNHPTMTKAWAHAREILLAPPAETDHE